MKLIQHSLKNLLFICVAMALFQSCAPKQETPISLKTELTAEGPFFSGPNSLIKDYTLDLSAFKGLEQLKSDDISEVKLKSALVQLREADGLSFNDFQSATLQLVGEDTGMQTTAILNPINTTKKEITLEVSSEVELTEYFQNPAFSLVLDLDFKEDSYADEIGAVVVLELSITHK